VFKIDALLADSAQVAEGKVNMLGGGWSVIVAGGPFAVCGKIHIPWHAGTDWHTLKLELVDADGDALHVPTPDGQEQPLVIELPPYRPNIAPHVKPGSWLDWPFAVNVGPGLPLRPGTFYEWRISINGTHQDDWSLAFSTAPVAPAMAA
jgi:hypothetical protein